MLERRLVMRKYIISVIVLVFVLCFAGCGKRYTESDVIGLNSSEIVEKYGNFDRKQGTPDADGLYRDCACGYLTTEKKTGFLGTTPPEYFMIYFNSEGIAHWCRYEKVI